MLYFDVVESWCFLVDNVNADVVFVRMESRRRRVIPFVAEELVDEE